MSWIPAPLPLSAAARRKLIARVLEARFSLSVLEKSRLDDRAHWASTRNDMMRGHYAEALREKDWLDASVDDVLRAEGSAVDLAREMD